MSGKGIVCSVGCPVLIGSAQQPLTRYDLERAQRSARNHHPHVAGPFTSGPDLSFLEPRVKIYLDRARLAQVDLRNAHIGREEVQALSGTFIL